MRNTVALILGGGRGTRLFPLTSIRSKPAVPLGGMYRLIDIPISNCINSDLKRIYVLTQFLSTSLHAHIRRTYNFDYFSGGFVEVLAAQETINEGTDWYQGTADAVRKNLANIRQADIDFVLILSGDQLYRMDYRQLLQAHLQTQADVTISCMPVTRQAATGFGIMRLDRNGRVQAFIEKPQQDAELDRFRVDSQWIADQGIEGGQRQYLASMGIYLFNRKLLVDLLADRGHADFGREVFPAAIEKHQVQAHLFDGYWEDIGTIRSFYEANLSLANQNPSFDFMTPQAPIYTRARYLPPTRMYGATVTGSLIANGCVIGQGSVIENSVIGLRTVVGRHVTIRNSIIMGADYYEHDASILACDSNPGIPLGIGDSTRIDGAIVDKDCRIGSGVTLDNDFGIENSCKENRRCVIRDGIPVIIKETIIENGTTLQSLLS